MEVKIIKMKVANSPKYTETTMLIILTMCKANEVPTYLFKEFVLKRS